MKEFCFMTASALLVGGAASLPAAVFTIGSPSAEPGSPVAVQITASDFADGTSAYSFNVNWDISVLQYHSARFEHAAAGATANFNPSQLASGRLGVQYSHPIDPLQITAEVPIVTLTFDVISNAPLGVMALSFGEGPSVTGVEPSNQPLTWVPGSVTVVPELPPNGPPTVSLAGPTNGATFIAPAIIAFNAGAVDRDGTVTLLEFLAGTNVLGTTVTSPYVFAWTNVPVGDYSLSARATDNTGATTTSAPVSITVHPNVPPTVRLTGPTNGATFTAPARVTLSADAADSDGTVTLLEFFVNTNLVWTTATSPYVFAWTNMPAGTYTLSARATDNGGASTVSAPVSITITPPPNVPPTVDLTGPIHGSTFTAPARVTFSAYAVDRDGTVTLVEFLSDGSVVGSDSTSPYSFAWTNVPAGTYTLSARATDNNGATTTSATVAITVRMTNRPPVPSSPILGRPASGGLKVHEQVLLGTDPDGDPLVLSTVDPTSALGAVVSTNDGWVIYTPPPGLIDPDAFGYTVGDGRGGFGVGTVTVVVAPSLEPGLNLTWESLTNLQVRLRGSGIPLETYSVEFAESLTEPIVWQPLGPVEVDANGLFEYLDQPPPGAPARFYRTTFP